MEDLNTLQEILEKAKRWDSDVTQQVADVEAITMTRLTRLQAVGEEVKTRISLGESASSHQSTQELLKRLSGSLVLELAKIEKLSKAVVHANDASLEATSARDRQLSLLLDFAPKPEMEIEEHLSKATALFVVQSMNHHRHALLGVRALAISDLIESYFTALSVFLDQPPVTQRARKAIQDLSFDYGVEAAKLLVEGVFGPISSTIQAVYKLFARNQQSRKLIKIGIAEYDRFPQLEDQLKYVAHQNAWAATVANASVESMQKADGLINDSLKILGHTIDFSSMSKPVLS